MYNNLRFVYITTSSKEEAKKIGYDLVEQRLAACANVFDGMESIYRWDGKVQEANESILILKTLESNIRAITDRVLELHSYTCPCIISLTIAEDEGHKPYIDWLIKNSS